MIKYTARLPGIEPPERPDYGQDVPRLAESTAVFGLLTSGIVIAHLVEFLSTGVFVALRSGTNLPPGEVIGLTILTVISCPVLCCIISRKPDKKRPCAK